MLVPLRLLAVARDVSGLPAHVAGLSAVGAVAWDVAGLVAVVAGLVGVASTLGAVSRNVPSLVAIVARRLIGALRTLARYVSRAVTSEKANKPRVNETKNTAKNIPYIWPKMVVNNVALEVDDSSRTHEKGSRVTIKFTQTWLTTADDANRSTSRHIDQFIYNIGQGQTPTRS